MFVILVSLFNIFVFVNVVFCYPPGTKFPSNPQPSSGGGGMGAASVTTQQPSASKTQPVRGNPRRPAATTGGKGTGKLGAASVSDAVYEPNSADDYVFDPKTNKFTLSSKASSNSARSSDPFEDITEFDGSTGNTQSSSTSVLDNLWSVSSNPTANHNSGAATISSANNRSPTRQSQVTTASSNANSAPSFNDFLKMLQSSNYLPGPAASGLFNSGTLSMPPHPSSAAPSSPSSAASLSPNNAVSASSFNNPQGNPFNYGPAANPYYPGSPMNTNGPNYVNSPWSNLNGYNPPSWWNNQPGNNAGINYNWNNWYNGGVAGYSTPNPGPNYYSPNYSPNYNPSPNPSYNGQQGWNSPIAPNSYNNNWNNPQLNGNWNYPTGRSGVNPYPGNNNNYNNANGGGGGTPDYSKWYQWYYQHGWYYDYQQRRWVRGTAN